MTAIRIIAIATALATSSSLAFAQSMPSDSAVVASRPMPDTAAMSPGAPGANAVNPAPGARGPYIGDGRHDFYDVDARIADVSSKIATLPPGQRRSAKAGLRSIKAEEATQRQRHGDLRDWDRENLNHRLDLLAQKFPALGSGGSQSTAGR